MGKKPIVSVTYENERISIKNSLPYLKCVLRLSCVVHVQFDALTVVDFTMLDVVWLAFHCRCHEHVVIIKLINNNNINY